MKVQSHIALTFSTFAWIILVIIKIQVQLCDLHLNVHVPLCTSADNIKMLMENHLTFHIQSIDTHCGYLIQMVMFMWKWKCNPTVAFSFPTFACTIWVKWKIVCYYVYCIWIFVLGYARMHFQSHALLCG